MKDMLKYIEYATTNGALMGKTDKKDLLNFNSLKLIEFLSAFLMNCLPIRLHFWNV